MVQVSVMVRDLKAGDRFRNSPDGHEGWAALADAVWVTASDKVRCEVQYLPDGAVGSRTWDDASKMLTVERMT